MCVFRQAVFRYRYEQTELHAQKYNKKLACCLTVIHSFNASLQILQNASFKEKWLRCSLAVSVENCLQTSWKCSAPARNHKLSLQIHQKGTRSSSRSLNTHRKKLKASAAVLYSGYVNVRLRESPHVCDIISLTDSPEKSLPAVPMRTVSGQSRTSL